MPRGVAMRRVLACLLFAVFVLSNGAGAKGSHSSGIHSSSHSSSHHTGSSHTHSGATHSGGSHSKADTGVKRDSHGKIARSEKAKDEFRKSHPCPSTGKAHGACPGYVIDHKQGLKHGGADEPFNMQW